MDVPEMQQTENSQRRWFSNWTHAFFDLANIMAAFIGSNYLSGPYGFYQGGVMFATVLWCLNIILNHYCCWLIIRAKHVMLDQLLEEFDKHADPFNPELTGRREQLRQRIMASCQPGHLAEYAFGKLGLISVEAAVAFTHFSIACVYFIFVADTFLIVIHDIPERRENPELFENISRSCKLPSSMFPATDFRDTWWMKGALMVLGVLFFLSTLIRKVRQLGILSMIGNSFIIYGTGILYYLMVVGIMKGVECPGEIKDINHSFPIFIGMMVPLFEGVGMMLPIHNGMKGNRRYFHVMLALSIYVVGGVATIFGIMGYYLFLGKTYDIILINFAQESDMRLTTAACGLFIIGVLFMYPMQNLPSIQLMEKWFFAKGVGCCYKHPDIFNVNEDDDKDEDLPILMSERHVGTIFRRVRHDPAAILDASAVDELYIEANMCQRVFLRIVLVILQGFVAYAVRKEYGIVFAYFGSIASFFLVFIFPCALHLRLEWFQLSKFWRTLDSSIIIFSICGALIAFIGTTVDIAIHGVPNT